jgi:hypothetical protein
MFILTNSAFSDASKCTYIKNVCDKLNKVVGIKTPMMIASGTIIDDKIIITNRHVVEDHKQFVIKFNNGEIKKAFPLPHNFSADLALLSLTKEPQKLNKLPKSVKIKGKIRVVAYDQGRNANRIYKSGKIISFSDFNRYPQARIHTNAKSLPGNSGGSVVDENGDLIGILASGDGNINEVIPVSLINKIIKNTDLKHKDDFFKIGNYIKLCADNLETAFNVQKNLDVNIVSNIDNYCWNSNNKQLIDQAGQTFGRLGDLKRAKKFLERSIQLDPNSPNALLSLAITFHISRDLENEKPIILKLLELTPENPQVLRLGVQVAGILKDKEMSNQVLGLMTKHNKEALPLAKKFIDNAFKTN